MVRIARAFVLLTLIYPYSLAMQNRKSRSLVFPRTTVFQLVLAMSTPIEVPNRTLGISVGLQLNFVLPSNASELNSLPEVSRRRRRKADLYQPLEELLDQAGFNGSACLLRTICEAAHSPFHWEEDDLLHEILHLVLRPSDLWDDHTNEIRQYVAAQRLGEAYGDCQAEFSTCSESPLGTYTSTLVPGEY